MISITPSRGSVCVCVRVCANVLCVRVCMCVHVLEKERESARKKKKERTKTKEKEKDIHPIALAVEPLLKNFRHLIELNIPCLKPLRMRFFKGREAHGLRHHNVVVEALLNII